MAGKPGRPRKERPEGDDSDKIWGVRGVHDSTRRVVKIYALSEGIAVGDAVDELVAMGMLLQRKLKGGGRPSERMHDKDALERAVDEAVQEILNASLDEEGEVDEPGE